MDVSHADPGLFRSVMSSFASSVSVVTTRGRDGLPYGLTSTAVCPASAEPPMVLVCVGLGSRTLPVIENSCGFAVNMLREGREALATVFAHSRPDKFSGAPWRFSDGAVGAPLLEDDVLAYVECALESSLPAGDHRVLLGRVVAMGCAAGRPLIYHRRDFTGLVGGSPQIDAS